MYDTLDNVLVDKWVIIKNIKGDDVLKRRFFDLGFLPDTLVLCALVSPFKDPRAYQVNDTLIAIRNKDAKNIEVEYARN